jgi:hypothetical protein
VNEEKNASRERAIQIKTRESKNAYKLARKKERRLFRKKARQLDEEALIVNFTSAWITFNDRRAKNGKLLDKKNQVLARWKKHFEEHLNEGSESE